MTDGIYDGRVCGMCGEPLDGDGEWCGNTDCPLGPDTDEESDDRTVNGEVEEVPPKEPPEPLKEAMDEHEPDRPDEDLSMPEDVQESDEPTLDSLESVDNDDG